MHTPKLRPQMGGCEINKESRQSYNNVLRWGLIAWACLRLVVSALWTTLIFSKTVSDYMEVKPEQLYSLEDPFVAFGVFAILAQLVEFGMLVTFIVAGIKKSADLYLSYYRYCILTLIIYIIAVALCLFLDYYEGHWFGEIYLTYHITNFEIPIINNDAIVLIIAASINICLEILLLYSIKRLINTYQYNAGYGSAENV